MADRIVDMENNLVYAVNDQPRQIATLEGLGLSADLAASEAASWRRWLPGGRMPWREITESERRVNELEQRRQQLEAKRAEVAGELQTAPSRDREVLAAWERDGRPGARPESTRPALEGELQQLQEEESALLLAVDQVTAERAEFVEKNRTRLVKDAAEVEDKAHERAQRALRELEEARTALVEARRLRLWSELYPAPEVGREPTWPLLAGGLKRALEKVGLQHIVAFEQVLAALGEDVSWLATAATAEQKSKLHPRPVSHEERGRARDRQAEDAWSVRRQLSHDRRLGDLAARRARL
jgi:hypothetical protein